MPCQRTGRIREKLRGEVPKPPVPGSRDKDQVNLTDEESRVVPVLRGGFDQCSNAQAGVDIGIMLIVSEHFTTTNLKSSSFLKH